MVGSRYALTVLAGKRARDLRDGAPQLVNSDSSNPILVALQEIYEGKVVPENLDLSAGIEEREAQMMAEAALAARSESTSARETARAILTGEEPAPPPPVDDLSEAAPEDLLAAAVAALAVPDSVAVSEAAPIAPELVDSAAAEEDEEEDLVDADEFQELDGNLLAADEVSTSEE